MADKNLGSIIIRIEDELTNIYRSAQKDMY